MFSPAILSSIARRASEGYCGVFIFINILHRTCLSPAVLYGVFWVGIYGGGLVRSVVNVHTSPVVRVQKLIASTRQ